MKNLLILAVSANLACLFVACVSASTIMPGIEKSGKQPEQTRVTLGEWNFAAPLPIGRLTGIDMHQNPDGVVARTVMRSWDFDRDTTVDMIEVLSMDGSVLRRFYDFDRDGKVDRVDDPVTE